MNITFPLSESNALNFNVTSTDQKSLFSSQGVTPSALPKKIAQRSLSTKSDIDLQKAHITRTLTLILSDHLPRVIESTCNVFIEALKDESSSSQLAPHLLNQLSVLPKLLPSPINELSPLIKKIPLKPFEKNAMLLLKVKKRILDEVFNNATLKTSLISLIAELLTEALLATQEIDSFTETNPGIPAKQKAVILGALQGVDEFLNALTQSMQAKGSFFKMSDYNVLYENPSKSLAFENTIISEMNTSLFKKGLLPSILDATNPKELDDQLFNLTRELCFTILADKHENEDNTALVHIASTYITNIAKNVFSPRTMLYLFNMLLTANPEQIVINKDPLKIHDQPFAEELDKGFQNLVLHGIHLKSTSILFNVSLTAIVLLILRLTKGEMGKGAVNSIGLMNQTPFDDSTINSIYNFLYPTSNEGKPTTEIKNLYSETDEEIKRRRDKIEELLKAGVPYEKINRLIKHCLKEETLPNELGLRLWVLFNKYSNSFKSICEDVSNSVYIISQRERLLNMLYCYLAIYIRKSLVREHGLNSIRKD